MTDAETLALLRSLLGAADNGQLVAIAEEVARERRRREAARGSRVMTYERN